jgi:hypothetical protein
MTLSLSLHLAYIGLILTLAIGAASAVKCGDSIKSNTVLTANLACDCTKFDNNAALTVVGPATLDLKGHSVSCTQNRPSLLTVCLAIRGKGATIKNGSVTACLYGFDDGNGDGASDRGAHIIKDIIVTATSL